MRLWSDFLISSIVISFLTFKSLDLNQLLIPHFLTSHVDWPWGSLNSSKLEEKWEWFFPQCIILLRRKNEISRFRSLWNVRRSLKVITVSPDAALLERFREHVLVFRWWELRIRCPFPVKSVSLKLQINVSVLKKKSNYLIKRKNRIFFKTWLWLYQMI